MVLDKPLANNHTTKTTEKPTDEKEHRSYNRRLIQWRVTWLIEHSTSHQLLWRIDSFMLRNSPHRQALLVIVQNYFRQNQS